MLKPITVAASCRPLVGSQTVARVKVWSPLLRMSPLASYASTLPSGISAMWIPTTGQLTTGPHCPISPSSPATAAAARSASAPEAACVRTASRFSLAALSATESSAAWPSTVLRGGLPR